MSARLLRGHVGARREPGEDAGSRARLLPLDRRALHAAARARACATGMRRGAARARGRRSRRSPLYRARASRSSSRATSTRPSSRSASTRPEGTSLGAMDEAMRAVEDEITATSAACGLVLASAGGGFLGGVNQGERLRAHRAARGAHVLASAGSGTSTLNGTPLARLPRQLHAARRDAGGPRAAAQVPAPARLGAQRRRRSTSAAATSTSTSRSAARTSSTLARYAEELRDRRARASSAASSTPTRRCKLDKPELRVDDRPRARRRPRASTPTDIATALRLMVGGDEEVSRFRDPTTNEDYDVQLRLDRAATASDAGDDRAALRAVVGAAGSCGSTTW